LGQKIEAHVGTPIDASNYSIEERDTLMQEVRAQILSLSQKPGAKEALNTSSARLLK
jgi:hypothetical protein